MTSQYELILLTDEITAEQEDAIYDEYDALVASHTGWSRLTATVEGTSVIDGAARLLRFLSSIGVRVQRFCEDLLTRGDIAQRAGVTRQAVGMWVRGERHGVFPPVHSTVAGGVWLSADVEAWLRANVSDYDGPDLSYPSQAEHVALAHFLLLQQQGDPVPHSEPLGRRVAVDRHDHGWSTVARVRGVDVTLAA